MSDRKESKTEASTSSSSTSSAKSGSSPVSGGGRGNAKTPVWVKRGDSRSSTPDSKEGKTSTRRTAPDTRGRGGRNLGGRGRGGFDIPEPTKQDYLNYQAQCDAKIDAVKMKLETEKLKAEDANNRGLKESIQNLQKYAELQSKYLDEQAKVKVCADRPPIDCRLRMDEDGEVEMEYYTPPLDLADFEIDASNGTTGNTINLMCAVLLVLLLCLLAHGWLLSIFWWAWGWATTLAQVFGRDSISIPFDTAWTLRTYVVQSLPKFLANHISLNIGGENCHLKNMCEHTLDIWKYEGAGATLSFTFELKCFLTLISVFVTQFFYFRARNLIYVLWFEETSKGVEARVQHLTERRGYRFSAVFREMTQAQLAYYEAGRHIAGERDMRAADMAPTDNLVRDARMYFVDIVETDQDGYDRERTIIVSGALISHNRARHFNLTPAALLNRIMATTSVNVPHHMGTVALDSAYLALRMAAQYQIHSNLLSMQDITLRYFQERDRQNSRSFSATLHEMWQSMWD